MKGAKMEGEKYEVAAHIITQYDWCRPCGRLVCMISGNVGGRSPSRSRYYYLQ